MIALAETLNDFPVVSVDTHFRYVSGFKYIDADAQKYRAMLLEIGVPPERAGSQNNIYIRPDYALAYTRMERVIEFLINPRDYTDAASCVENAEGGVDIVIVYGAGHDVNELLRHEAYHAVKILTADNDDKSHGLLPSFRRILTARKVARQEEEDADKLMEDPHMRSNYGNIIMTNDDAG